MYTGKPPWNDCSALTTLYALDNLDLWPDTVDPSVLPLDLTGFLPNTFQHQADERRSHLPCFVPLKHIIFLCAPACSCV
ncbi:hypothetical protein DIPPA_20619 [Diplonema papillatum]|nr:hypothetical protein DIPPA_20619 [Diplonema papillatum]